MQILVTGYVEFGHISFMCWVNLREYKHQYIYGKNYSVIYIDLSGGSFRVNITPSGVIRSRFKFKGELDDLIDDTFCRDLEEKVISQTVQRREIRHVFPREFKSLDTKLNILPVVFLNNDGSSTSYTLPGDSSPWELRKMSLKLLGQGINPLDMKSYVRDALTGYMSFSIIPLNYLQYFTK